MHGVTERGAARALQESIESVQEDELAGNTHVDNGRAEEPNK